MEELAGGGKGVALDAAVEGIPGNGVADGLHVHPDLMGAAGFQAEGHKGVRLLVAALHGEMGDGIPAPFHGGHAHPVPGMAADGHVDGAGIGLHPTLDQGAVLAGDAVGSQLAGQALVGQVVLGHHEQPRGVLVDAVDDARPQDAVDAGQIPGVVQQGVDQGPGAGPRRRVDHHAHGLVDHQHIPVLIDDVQGNGLGLHLVGLGLGDA